MALLDELGARVERHARTAAGEAISLVETALIDVPGIKVEREGDELAISGRGLMRRWLSDTRLRLVGRWRR